MTQSELLAQTFEQVRLLTKFYLKKLASVDKTKTYKFGDVTFKSILWETAHIAWSENFLLIKGLTENSLDFDWFEQVQIGSDGTLNSDFPGYEQILIDMDKIHELAIQSILLLSDKDLEQPNNLGMNIAGSDTKRSLIQHAIRHEPCHTGHLGWIAKLNQIKVI